MSVTQMMYRERQRAREFERQSTVSKLHLSTKLLPPEQLFTAPHKKQLTTRNTSTYNKYNEFVNILPQGLSGIQEMNGMIGNHTKPRLFVKLGNKWNCGNPSKRYGYVTQILRSPN